MSTSLSSPLFLPSLSTFLSTLPLNTELSVLLYNETTHVILKRERISDGGRKAIEMIAKNLKVKGKSDLGEVRRGCS